MAFESAWAKVKRARAHRDALYEDIEATFREVEKRPRVGTKYEEETGDHVVHVTFMPDLTDLLERSSLIFGDAIHNLRSALDHVAYELAFTYTNGQIQDPRRVAFPITDDDGWWGRQSYRVSEIDPNEAALIKWHQPYEALSRAGATPGTTTRLGMLRDFDDWDKHRLLTVVAVPDAGLSDPHPQALYIWTQYAFARLNAPGSVPLTVTELGAVVARAKLPDDERLADMDMAGYLSGTIHVADGNLPILAVLDALAERVTEVVRAFDRT